MAIWRRSEGGGEFFNKKNSYINGPIFFFSLKLRDGGITCVFRGNIHY